MNKLRIVRIVNKHRYYKQNQFRFLCLNIRNNGQSWSAVDRLGIDIFLWNFAAVQRNSMIFSIITYGQMVSKVCLQMMRRSFEELCNSYVVREKQMWQLQIYTKKSVMHLKPVMCHVLTNEELALAFLEYNVHVKNF